MHGIIGAMILLMTAFGVLAADSVPATFPVANVTIQAGDTLTDELVTERTLFANSIAMRTHFTMREKVIGKVARRTIVAGAAIPLNALRDPLVFKDGERVILEFKSGSLRIRSAGIALQPGIAGETVRVRNVDTGAVVNGIAGADGIVTVGGGAS